MTAPRALQIPKLGGFLPMIAILTALSAIGGLASGGSAIVKSINKAKAARERFNEAQRHNKMMEAIAIGGKGMYLKPYRKGYGLYYKPLNFKNLIKLLSSRPLTDVDLKHFARHIQCFRGIFIRDNLPNHVYSKECGIINLDSEKGSGTHWVAYYKNKNHLEYFDSFGNLQPPKEVIIYLGKKHKLQLHTRTKNLHLWSFMSTISIQNRKKRSVKYFIFYDLSKILHYLNCKGNY